MNKNYRHGLSDAEIDNMAKKYAVDHRVCYMEALVTVMEGAEIAREDRAAGTTARSAPTNDAEFDRRARSYAIRHQVSYSEAARAVSEEFHVPHFSEPVRSSAGRTMPSDAELHRLTENYARRHRIDYTEALSAVTLQFRDIEFREHAGSQQFSFTIAFAEQAMGGVPASIEILRVGRSTAKNGQVKDFSLDDLQGMASAYRSAIHEAPLILGTSEHSDPAAGWVKLLYVSNGRLLADIGQADDAFTAAQRAGQLKKKVVSFYSPEDPENPVTGSWYLRSIAWPDADARAATMPGA